MINKLKAKRGSAMTLAIVVLLIVGISGTTMTSMVMNQMKSTKNSYDTMDVSYQAEAEVDTLVADYIDQIEVKGERGYNVNYDLLLWYFMIAHRYIEVAETYAKFYDTEYSKDVIKRLKLKPTQSGYLVNPYANVYTLKGDNGHIGHFEEELEKYISADCVCFDTCKGNSCTVCKTNNNRPNNNNNSKKCSSIMIKSLKLSDLESIHNRFGQISNLIELSFNDSSYTKTNATMELQKIMDVCRDYLGLIMQYVHQDNSGGTDSLKFSRFTIDECNEFIRMTLNNISKTEYSYKNNDKNYGSVGVLYRNVYKMRNLSTHNNCSTSNSYCKAVCTLNKDLVYKAPSEYGQLTKDIESFLDTENKNNTQEKLESIIKKINTYASNLNFSVNTSTYNTGFKAIYKFYTGVTASNYKDVTGGNHNIVKQLKTGIDYELKFLSYLLGIYNSLEYGGSSNPGNNDIAGGSGGVQSSFTIEIPKNIGIEGRSSTVVKEVLERNCKENNMNLYEDSTNNKYILTVKQSNTTNYKAVFDIDVDASIKNHNIKSTVGLIISPALSENMYEINYQVKDWNKVS